MILKRIAYLLLSLCYTGEMEAPYIILGNGNKIQRISLDGRNGVEIVNSTDYDVIGVDYDIRYDVIRCIPELYFSLPIIWV